MFNNTDQWVDAIVDELNRLYQKDTNQRKMLLGNGGVFIKKVFDEYVDWIMMNKQMSPIQVSRTIYKDLINIGYFDFTKKALRKDKIQSGSMGGFDLIFGSADEIENTYKQLAKIKANDSFRYDLILKGLQYVREVSKKASSNSSAFSGAKMVQQKDPANLNRMPTYSTFLTFSKMPTKDLDAYVKKLKNDLKKMGVAV